MEQERTRTEQIPAWLWRLVLGGTLAVALVVAGGALAIGLGAADPPIHGAALWQDGALSWAQGPDLDLDPLREIWAAALDDAALPDGSFTLAVRAEIAATSDPGTAWGVWIAQVDGTRVVWALSGDLYLTTRICPGAEAPAALENCPAAQPDWRWMPYNRVRAPGAVNEIALHRDAAGAIRLWLNGERLGIMDVQPGGSWGVWARGGRSGTAAIRWLRASILAAN
ncbi:MAG TPA: hypothetical protein PKD09_24730 [Aggregatilinea sp.]|uniref:hypothetical protein n=1 Tax=Aggregatilinea sp. TaxID=2806333 RepID=UPI002BFE88ED|nr:hypothetical protein [Aggregatilinea sp.]HML24884.1 hypothetical protein [Aggregatilinea sp.]